MTIRYKRPDRKNAESILQAAKREMAFTFTVNPTEDSASTIVRNIYEAFRMLGDSLLVSRGIKSEDHLLPIRKLLSLKVDTARPISLIDNLRRLRHNVNYYGYHPSKLEAEDALSLAKACFEPLYQEVRKIVRKG